MKMLRMILFTVGWLWLSHPAHAAWIELEGVDRETQYAVAMAALESHWKHTERGWCRVHLDTRSLDERIIEIEISWSDSRVGIQTRDATGHVLQGKPLGVIESIKTYGPKECWAFSPYHTVNSLSGWGGRELRKLSSDMKCCPHDMWLSIYRGQIPEWTHRKLMQPIEDCKLFRSSDEKRIRMQKGVMVLEFDVASDYSPVLFETNMNVVGLPVQGRFPLREIYEVGQDTHGVWYCKSTEKISWGQGLDQDPDSHLKVSVMEYDSDPPPEKMRLDYKSIGAIDSTKVTSYIPGRSGSWKYGKGKDDKSADEEAALRAASKRMLERGFSKEQPSGQKAGQP